MPVPEVGASDLSRKGQDRPMVSMEGWARFEQRTRQRRIEHRLQAARTAIDSRQWADARAALDELKELNPNLPELDALTSEIARGATGARSRRGVFVLAAAAFATVMLTASWIENTRHLPSSREVAPVPVAPAREPAPVAPAREPVLVSRDTASELRDVALALPVPTASSAVTEALSEAAAIDPPPVPVPPAPSDQPSGLAGPAQGAPATAPIPSPVPVSAAASPPASASPSVPAPLTPSVSLPSQLELPPATVPEPVFPPPVAPPVRPPVAPAPAAANAAASSATADAGGPAAAVVDDATQVRAVLQKYQAAYERLDAALVHAVWPGVNEAALARAFEGLESQALTFKACDIQVRGATANVACTGTTRYVPKIGSREPRVEPLAWNFTLRKRANDWHIESARAER